MTQRADLEKTELYLPGRCNCRARLSLPSSRGNVMCCVRFSQVTRMVAQSLLVFCADRSFTFRIAQSHPVRTTLTHYPHRHDLNQASAAGRWLREQVRGAAPGMAKTEQAA